MTKWEYKSETTDRWLELFLNEQGELGWELVSVIRCDDGWHDCYFKRPREDTA